jgi:hypothetical protein
VRAHGPQVAVDQIFTVVITNSAGHQEKGWRNPVFDIVGADSCRAILREAVRTSIAD